MSVFRTRSTRCRFGYVKCVHFLYKPHDNIRGVDNSPPTRYLIYKFTCPKGHVNKRESMVFAGTPSDAVRAVLDQVLECSVCESPLADKSVVAVLENLDMPSAPSEE
jgi:hypothetical protein